MTLPGFDAAVRRAAHATAASLLAPHTVKRGAVEAGARLAESAVNETVRPLFEEVVGALERARFVMFNARDTGAHPKTDEELLAAVAMVDAALARLREPKEGTS